MENNILEQVPLNPIDISTMNITLYSRTFVYNGKTIEPEVIVKNEEELLIEDTDYTLSYFDNKDVGKAYVIITGIGNYNGSVRKEYIINPCNIVDVDITCGEQDEYGCYNLKNLSLTIGDYKLVEDIDYIKEITIIRGSEYFISKVLFVCIDNFAGEIIKTYNTAKIEITNIQSALCELSSTKYVYNGFSNKPIPKLTDGNYILISDVDYTYTYLNNINAGIGEIIIEGIGNYTNIRREEFQITQADISTGGFLSCGVPDEDGYYNLKNIAVSFNSKILKRNEDYIYSVEQEIDYENKSIISIVTVSGKNNYTGNITNQFVTSKYVIDISTIDIRLSSTDFIYDGQIIKPNVIVPDELIINEDYTISCDDNINAGIYRVLVKGINYYKGQKELWYNINCDDISDSDITCGEPDIEGCYDISNLDVSLNGTKLILSIDYIVYTETYEKEDNYFNTSITITGIRNYQGTCTVDFPTSRKSIYIGKKILLDNTPIYPRYFCNTVSSYKSGLFYLWDDKVINGRIRITSNIDYIKEIGFITGWVLKDDFLNKNGILVGDSVTVTGNINTNPSGSGNNIVKDGDIMYVVEKLDSEQYKYCYGLALTKNRTTQGWATSSMLTKNNI